MYHSLEKLKKEVFSTPIKDLLSIESERKEFENLITLSIRVEERFTMDDHVVREYPQMMNKILKRKEDSLFKRIRRIIIEAIVSYGRRDFPESTHLFGLPYRIVEDLDIEEGAVIILTPQRYYELRERETEGRNLIFTGSDSKN